MGLDIDCKCGKHSFRAGSYSGFHWFRVQLARSSFLRDYEKPTDKEWKWFQKHSLSPFWMHSDCDGKLTSAQCKRMLPTWQSAYDCLQRKPFSKRELFKRLFGNSLTQSDEDYFMDKMKDWLNIIKHCARNKCEIIFC